MKRLLLLLIPCVCYGHVLDYVTDPPKEGVLQLFEDEWGETYNTDVPEGLDKSEYIAWFHASDDAESYNFQMVNCYREYSGLPKLLYDYDVASAAYLHSIEMVWTDNFSHVGEIYGAGSKERIEYVTGIEYPDTGENIYLHYAREQYSPKFIGIMAFMAFYNSDGHNENMLHWYWYYTGIDISVFWDSDYDCYRYYCTQNYRGLYNTDYSTTH